MKHKTAAGALACFLLLVTGCSSLSTEDPNYTTPQETAAGTPVPTETAASDTEETAAPDTTDPGADGTVHFLAVGDDLIHTRVYKTAAEHAENGEEYNFGYCYAHVADRIEAADIAFINQETLICGEGYEVTGSNLNFNSPEALGDALIDIGFDVIGIGNNHILDKGEDGLGACLDYWHSQVEAHPGLLVLGAYRDYQDEYDYRITEVNGVKVGFLAYTEHTNGYALPSGSEKEIPYTTDRELMQKQISELSEQVDCVVVSAHWGVEDTHVVTDAVKSLAQDLVDWGADVIIGTGPHTLQTMEYLTRDDGTKGFVYYSLGNFISGQTDSFNMVGGMAQFDIVKTGGEVTIESPVVTPLITQYDDGNLSNVRVYPYDEYTDDLVAQHGLPYSPWGTAKVWSREVIENIIQGNVPEQYQKLTKN